MLAGSVSLKRFGTVAAAAAGLQLQVCGRGAIDMRYQARLVLSCPGRNDACSLPPWPRDASKLIGRRRGLAALAATLGSGGVPGGIRGGDGIRATGEASSGGDWRGGASLLLSPFTSGEGVEIGRPPPVHWAKAPEIKKISPNEHRQYSVINPQSTIRG